VSVEFEVLPLAGAYRITFEPQLDERGFFARIWDSKEFAARGLNSNLAQSSLSHNLHRGTVRGLHYQVAPHEEAKLVTCVRGSIWDVIVDLRPDSPTYRRWHAVELSDASVTSVFVPEQFAHGYQTLEDDSLVLYEITVPYHPKASRGLRWDDPALQIAWPVVDARIISLRDKRHPLLAP
jgi:dTDP-4-dehydrorhamnose 3,5-epimerase